MLILLICILRLSLGWGSLICLSALFYQLFYFKLKSVSVRLWNQCGIFLPLSVFDVSSCPRLRSPVVCNPSSAPGDHQLFLSSKKSSEAVRLGFALRWDCVFHSYVFSSSCTCISSALGTKTTNPGWGKTGSVWRIQADVSILSDVGFTWVERWHNWVQSHYTTLTDSIKLGSFLVLPVLSLAAVSLRLTRSDTCSLCGLQGLSGIHSARAHLECRTPASECPIPLFASLRRRSCSETAARAPVPSRCFAQLDLTVRSVNALWHVLDVTDHPQRWRGTNPPASPRCFHQNTSC